MVAVAVLTHHTAHLTIYLLLRKIGVGHEGRGRDLTHHHCDGVENDLRPLRVRKRHEGVGLLLFFFVMDVAGLKDVLNVAADPTDEIGDRRGFKLFVSLILTHRPQ